MSGLALQPDLQNIQDFESIFEDVKPYVREFPACQLTFEVILKVPKPRKIKGDITLENLKVLSQNLNGFIRPKTVLVLIGLINFAAGVIETHWDEFPVEAQKACEELAYKIIHSSPQDETHPKYWGIAREWQRFVWKLSFSIASIAFRTNVFELYKESMVNFSFLTIKKAECSNSICQLVFAATSAKISQEELASADELISRVFAEPEENISSKEIWSRFDEAWTTATKEAQARW